MALISLRVCAGWSEPLLVAHTTLLEILCTGSILLYLQYGECSKILNTFLLFLNELLIIKAGFNKMLVRVANSEDPDQTASEEAV